MKIVIYQTSDLHGYIYPTNYVNDQPLGFLKIASYILNDEKNYDAELIADGFREEQICHFGFAFEGKHVLIG